VAKRQQKHTIVFTKRKQMLGRSRKVHS
jgi:hypothetical protein